MWRYRKRRIPDRQGLPPLQKRKRLQPPSAAPDLSSIESGIEKIELEIKAQVARFETVRAEMLTGIVTHDGVSAKTAVEELTATLAKLKEDRAFALRELDKHVYDAAVLRSAVPAVSEPGCCEGGCKPSDMMCGPDCMDVCCKCHKTYDRRVDNVPENLAFGEYHPPSRVGGYKPPNHFAEIILQFQGKRRSSAPQEIVDKIRTLCERYKIGKEKITPRVVRMFLKQLQTEQAARRKYDKKSVPENAKKFTDYYKHCTEMAYTLSGIPPPWMTPMQEDKASAVFLSVIQGYRTSPRFLERKKNRKTLKTREDPNNMNYLYVFYKICQLLGYECFLPYISLPKSTANIDDNDENGWKHICELYGWSYTPTR